MKCEINIETMTYKDSWVIWLSTLIHSAWKNKLEIPCKSTIFCKCLWWLIKGPNSSLKASTLSACQGWRVLDATRFFTAVFTGKYRPGKNRFWTSKVGKKRENTTLVLFKQFSTSIEYLIGPWNIETQEWIIFIHIQMMFSNALFCHRFF